MTPRAEEPLSERILNDIRQRSREKEIVDVEEEQVKVVIFTCGGGRYAFYGSDIREILPPCEIAWVPGLPPYLPGLINVRGDIESIIDLGHFLAAQKSDAGRGLIAMAVRGDFRSGVMIDAIEDVVDIPASAVRPPLSTLSGVVRDLVAGEIDRGGKPVALIGIENLAAQIAL